MIRSIERTSRVWVRVAVLFLVIVGSLALVTAVTLAAQSSPVVESEAAVASPDCVDFESLPLSGEYVVGDVFVDSGVIMRALPFEWSNGTVYHRRVGQHRQYGFCRRNGSRNSAQQHQLWPSTLANPSMAFHSCLVNMAAI